MGHAECAEDSEPERFNEQVQGRAGQNARFDNRVPIDAADYAMRSDAKYSSLRQDGLVPTAQPPTCSRSSVRDFLPSGSISAIALLDLQKNRRCRGMLRQ